MDLRVDFHGGSVAFEADPTVVLAAWTGPIAPAAAGNLLALTAAALESPIDFPPLRQVVVPGDRIVIALDGNLASLPEVLAAVTQVLWQSGVESINVLVDGRAFPQTPIALPEGVTLVRHDPSDRETMAYLATTESGRRIYLNRLLADADCVIPIGLVGFSDDGRATGPWSVIEPGLGDSVEPLVPILGNALRRKSAPEPETQANPLTEVSWLLGCQFQVGVIPGRDGIAEVLAGESAAVSAELERRLKSAWLLEPEARADLVVAGVGAPGRPASPRDFVRALRQGIAAVQRCGKIALLCDFDLPSLNEALAETNLLEGDLARAIAWADIYLHSRVSADDVEELGMLAIDRVAQVGKLAASAHTVITINQADRTRVAAKSS